MNIQQVDGAKAGKFFLKEQDKQLAEMIYTWAENGDMVIQHTEVDPSLKGKGVGFALVSAAVEQAQSKGFKLHANCPYAAAVLKKTKAFHDVMADSIDH